jgi:probable F420-dependent oxidoreductase
MTEPKKRPLKIGLFLPAAEHFHGGGTPRWTDIVALARLSEDAGFDSIWILDHLLAEDATPGYEVDHIGVWECWSLLAGLAAATTTVDIGPFVSNMALRNPALLAKTADTVDEISGGRLILGLGAGWHQHEFDAFGYPFDHRASRFEEGIQIIHGLLKTGRVDFEGRFHTARDCELRPRGPRPHGPPIMIGTHGERMMRLAARYADLWNAEWLVHPEEAVPILARLDEACVEVGRDPTTLERTLGLLVDAPGLAPRPGSDRITDHRLALKRPLSGSVDELAEQFMGFADLGISHLQVWLGPNTAQGIEAFAPVLEALDRN